MKKVSSKIPLVAIVMPMKYGNSSLIARGISEYMKLNHPWRIYLDDHGDAADSPFDLDSKNLQGVICRNTTQKLVDYCKKSKIPLISMLDSQSFEGVSESVFDNVGMGHSAAEYLIEKGARSIGYYNFKNESWANMRKEGFLEALKLCKKSYSLLEVEYFSQVPTNWLIKQEENLIEWFSTLAKPASILCCNDFAARIATNACLKYSIPVPEEISILGMNNELSRCELSYPQISSVNPNPERVGYNAAYLLDKQMHEKELPTLRIVSDSIGVVERRSTEFNLIDDPRVAKALNFIHEHATRGITVDDVCKYAGASRSLLERRFRKELNRTPQSQIRMVQVEKAKQLLRETDWTLDQIAENLGYEHSEYLSVVFKRITGNSPGKYRKENAV